MSEPAHDPLNGDLLVIERLKTWFPIRRGLFGRTRGYVRAVDGVSLRLAPAESLGLVGESGCGKSTLARSLLRLAPVHSGRILFAGHDLLALSERALRPLRRQLQMVFQDPYASLNPRMTIGDIVTEGLHEQERLSRRARQEAAAHWLAEVGLDPGDSQRYPHEFSGGQRQRVSVARAVALRPRLVVCDEAVSALDVSVRAQVLNLLLDLGRRFSLAYLFISHDLGVVRHTCDRVVVMYLGKVVEEGPAAEVIDTPRHPYTQALVAALPRISDPAPARIRLAGEVPSAAHPPPGCRFHTRCPHAQARCRAAPPALARLEGGTAGHRAACWRRNEATLRAPPAPQ